MIQEAGRTTVPLEHNFKGGSQDAVFVYCAIIIDQNMLSGNSASCFLLVSPSISYIPLTAMVVYHFENYK